MNIRTLRSDYSCGHGQVCPGKVHTGDRPRCYPRNTAFCNMLNVKVMKSWRLPLRFQNKFGKTTVNSGIRVSDRNADSIMYAVVRIEALMETLGRQRCQEHRTSGACICEPYARFGRQPAMVLKGDWHFVGANEAWQMDVESLVVCASSTYSPILLFLCSFELSFSIRWIALVYHKLPIVMFCFIKGPKATQSRDHRLKPTKLGTQINLSCSYVVYFEYFLIAMKRRLRLKKATGRTQSQSERGHVGCSQKSYRDRLSQILGTHYDIICTECKT